MTGPEDDDDPADWRPIAVNVRAAGHEVDECDWCARPFDLEDSGYEFRQAPGLLFCSRRCAVDWQRRQAVE